jgi:hypothetical protein
MRTRCTIVAILSQAVILASLASFAQAQPNQPDTTRVMTFNEEFINWADPHIQQFAFPSNPERFSQVLLYMTLGCPTAPGDCDPWDRLGHLRIIHEDPPGVETHIEIARFITPYDITGGANMPGACTWVFDVTDYKFLLKDQVTLRAYIESWIGGARGWLLTCEFAFVHGATLLQPYKVVNLWTVDWAEYGNPDNPIENLIAPVAVDIPADAEAAKVRAITTGHGQGNTFNCAEFCPRQHSVVAGDQTFTHTLWRNDCSQNDCSPQYGTWQYARAGWCPGDKVYPWDNDVSSLIVPGQPLLFDYNVQDYFNQCGPHNPDCVDGQTCPDCDYNYEGHTIPIYVVNGQLILYRSDPTAAEGPETASPPQGLVLGQNFPNPFNPATTFYYELAEGGRVDLRIFSAGGRLLKEEIREHAAGGRYWYQWDGRDETGAVSPTGVYFYEVCTPETSQARKMILLQ